MNPHAWFGHSLLPLSYDSTTGESGTQWHPRRFRHEAGTGAVGKGGGNIHTLTARDTRSRLATTSPLPLAPQPAVIVTVRQGEPNVQGLFPSRRSYRGHRARLHDHDPDELVAHVSLLQRKDGTAGAAGIADMLEQFARPMKYEGGLVRGFTRTRARPFPSCLALNRCVWWPSARRLTCRHTSGAGMATIAGPAVGLHQRSHTR